MGCFRLFVGLDGFCLEGFGYSTQNRRVVDPIAFAWKGLVDGEG